MLINKLKMNLSCYAVNCIDNRTGEKRKIQVVLRDASPNIGQHHAVAEALYDYGYKIIDAGKIGDYDIELDLLEAYEEAHAKMKNVMPPDAVWG